MNIDNSFCLSSLEKELDNIKNTSTEESFAFLCRNTINEINYFRYYVNTYVIPAILQNDYFKTYSILMCKYHRESYDHICDFSCNYIDIGLLLFDTVYPENIDTFLNSHEYLKTILSKLNEECIYNNVSSDTYYNLCDLVLTGNIIFVNSILICMHYNPVECCYVFTNLKNYLEAKFV